MQGTKAWQILNGDKIITVGPQERFKAGNGNALVAAARAVELDREPRIQSGQRLFFGRMLPHRYFAVSKLRCSFSTI